MKKKIVHSKNKLFILFSILFLIGIFINNLFLNIYTSLLILVFLLVFFFNFVVYYKKYTISLFISLIGFLLGIVISYYNTIEINSKENLLYPYLNNYNQSIVVEIKEVYKIEDFQNQYVAILKEINSIKIKEEILSIIIVPANFTLDKGYVIKGNSKLYGFKNFSGFNYKNYLLSKNIYFKSYFTYFDTLDKKELNIIEKNIRYYRKMFLDIIYKLYPKEEAIFLGGILLGARESLPAELKTDFNNSGLTHFIAVSGFNITILIIFFSFILKYFPVWFRVISVTIFIILFTILVGFTPPVIRAAIMGLIGYYVLSSGRSGNTLSIILLTAVIMVIFTPYSINYDISLHLSFLAVIGIVYTQDFFKRIFYFLPNALAINEAFVLTLASLSFTLPIMIFNFGQVSILAPFANIAVTWSIPIAMFFGFLSIIVYLVSPFISYFISYFTWIFLKWDIMVVHFFGKSEWAILRFDFLAYKNYLEILYFVILIFLITYFRKTKKT